MADPEARTGRSSCPNGVTASFQRLFKLPWTTIALISHAILYITLTLVMLFVVDNYKAYDGADTTTETASQTESRLRSDDIITAVSAATVAVQWVAGVWVTNVVTKSGYIVWMKTRQTHSKEKIIDKIRWAMEYRFPIKLGLRTDYNLIRISIFLVLPALIASPILEGALSWKSSSEAAGSATARSGNPEAQFYSWNFITSAEGKVGHDLIWNAASLAGIAWENGTSASTDLKETKSQKCRHVTTHDQFPAGTKLHNATIPCIVVHSISWPKKPMPQSVENVLNNSEVITAAGRPPILRTQPGTVLVFDPTNKTLPTPPVMTTKNGNFNITRETVYVDQPPYPAPFTWAGSMTAIVYLTQHVAFPPYVMDVFGVEEPNNEVALGATVVWAKGEVKPQQTFTYLEINFTAGIVNPATSTYVKQNVIEADDNDLDGKDIVEGPWVRDALYLTSDIMSCLAISNSTGISSWQSLENYTETMIRFSYMAAWSLLQRSYEPNSTLLTVDLYETRIQAVVSQWRVISWLGINVAFSLSWITVTVLMKRSKELAGVDTVPDFILRLYTHFEHLAQQENT
ncbi:hypothetical protein QC762_511270 [Podospora pseudocomata]|uniref:Transmembrane protein n=1 Tax=Podospora pseudocomata TaxID=2093779 RepID=A0ABR0GDX9_9PEZI|nr:hypothetical protein QC762_511270 [Podospora pseudocomata]